MSIGNRIRSFLQSPKGRQVINRGRTELSKPENQAKIRSLMNRRGRRR